MADFAPAASAKRAARTFDFEALMEQARTGAQERSKVDWDSEIEKAKEENESRLAEMKLKANDAAKKMPGSTNSSSAVDDDDDEDFGPSLNLATASTADDNDDDDDDNSSDDDDKQQAEVRGSHNSSSGNRKALLDCFSPRTSMPIDWTMTNSHFYPSPMKWIWNMARNLSRV